VVFGSGAVGKSSVTLRFVSDTFTPEYLPTIEDCHRKTCTVDGIVALLEILDTAGQEEYGALRDSWVRQGDAFLLVFSCTSRLSLKELGLFRERILLVNEEREMQIPMILVCNKVDLKTERRVTQQEALAVAKEYGNIPYVECSALEGSGCDEAFYAAVRSARQANPSRNRQEEKSRSWCVLL